MFKKKDRQIPIIDWNNASISAQGYVGYHWDKKAFLNMPYRLPCEDLVPREECVTIYVHIVFQEQQGLHFHENRA